ncbi:hypothetical protein LJB82_03935 [Desulfovibrio sp. OttesenSCG-928-M16]|nr:hypothetical protein [Desulfovibrio sp. OttesenSCG-928-M16]
MNPLPPVFLRFRLFLSASVEVYGEIMDFEERLAGAEPFGMPFLRLCTARLTVAAMQCAMQLNALSGGDYERLNEPFARLRMSVQQSLSLAVTPLSGPLVLPFDDLEEEYLDIVSTNLVKLAAVRREHPEFLPRGFIVTGAAWWEYFNNPDLHDEIDRLMIISQDDPDSFSEAGITIRERMARSFPLPAKVEKEVRAHLAARYPEMDSPGHTLLVRCLPVNCEHGALVMPEQVLSTPLDADDVLKAIRSSLSMAYRTRAIIYRLKRGLRDRAMPFCVSLTLMNAVHARGSVHRALDESEGDNLLLHVRRSFSTPDSWPSQTAQEGASLPDAVRDKVMRSASAALDCLKDAPVRGNRHEIFWSASEDGNFYVLGVNALADPLPNVQPAPLCKDSEACLEGGVCAYPGQALAPLYTVRNFTDALMFPIGHILVVQSPSPRWSFLLDFASGAIAGDGTGNGLFARTARRYGRPTLLRLPAAFENLETGQRVLLEARNASSTVRPVPETTDLAPPPSDYGVPDAAWPLEADLCSGEAPTWLPRGDVAQIARELAPLVAGLTLPDADHVDFRAENCKSFNDFVNYCNVHAVREMFRAGTTRKSASSPAKQLVSDVPTQFWIVNLDDGFKGEIKGPVVSLDQIASIPFKALWEGFTDKPWEGPPAINAKGFLSVLFEATVNPNLDPASQSTTYTDKNVFLIAKRFCSMRCRFGFHFLALDCLVSEREKERFIIFQFKGGAANLTRRIRRVHFVAELLSQFDFATEISGDTLTARLEGVSEELCVSALRVLGYLTMHTRQLDMIMSDEAALAAYRFQMMEDMLALAERDSS